MVRAEWDVGIKYLVCLQEQTQAGITASPTKFLAAATHPTIPMRLVTTMERFITFMLIIVTPGYTPILGEGVLQKFQE